MSSVATMNMPDLGYTPNKFTLHNASPERVDVRWGGLAFTLPAVDEVGPKTAYDIDGVAIPGTLVLADATSTDRDGMVPPLGSPPNWSAFEAIRNVLGVNASTKKAEGVLAKAGVSYLPNTPTKDVIAFVRADGEARYREYQLEWAEHTVGAYEAVVQKAREVGVVPRPPGKDYLKATVILGAQKRVIEQSMRVPNPQATDDEEMEFEVYAKAAAMELAAKGAEGKNVDKAQLAEELLKDPKVRAHLSRKFSIRQRGHLDVPEPEAPQEG